jgi:hypothetical protein
LRPFTWRKGRRRGSSALSPSVVARAIAIGSAGLRTTTTGAGRQEATHGGDPGTYLRLRDYPSTTVRARVVHRRRHLPVRDYHEAARLSNAQTGEPIRISSARIKAYFYDPTGAKARAVKARYRGVCRGCGAPTAPRNGKGDAFAYCKRCHPGAIAPEWTRERVRETMRAWRSRFGAAPSSYDWSRTHARRRGGEALKRVQAGDWPAPSTVIHLYGSWAAAVADAFSGA